MFSASNSEGASSHLVILRLEARGAGGLYVCSIYLQIIQELVSWGVESGSASFPHWVLSGLPDFPGLPGLSGCLSCLLHMTIAASLAVCAVVRKGCLEMLGQDVSPGRAGTAIGSPALESPLLPKSHILRVTQCIVLFIVWKTCVTREVHDLCALYS